MIYTITTTRKALIEETLLIEVESTTLADAMDQAHELASIDPDPQIRALRFVTADREYVSISDIDTSFDSVESSEISNDS